MKTKNDPGNGKSHLVAVLVPNLGSSFHMMVFRGLSEVLTRHRYGTLFHNVGHEDEEDPGTLANLAVCKPDGYIILRGAQGLSAKHASAILDAKIPLVSLGLLEDVSTHAIAIDNRLVMRLAADYVIERGHRHLGFLAGPAFSMAAKHRMEGLEQSLEKHGIPKSDVTIIHNGVRPGEEYEAARQMLKNPKTRPTAVLCFYDTLALHIYRAAHEFSLAIPDDLSVIGVDGVDDTAISDPPLTTVNTFPEHSGAQAAELLVKAMRNELEDDAVVQWVEPAILERGSVRAI